MNTGQMLFVLGAFALLSTLSVSVYNAQLQSDRVAVETQAGLQAVRICQEQLESAVAAGYDSLAVGNQAEAVLTPFETFYCSTFVDYVTAVAPDSAVAGPTPFKRVRVRASSAYGAGAVALGVVVGKP